jgi:hypothetical protein
MSRHVISLFCVGILLLLGSIAPDTAEAGILFQARTDYVIDGHPQAIERGDLNGDAALDLVVANSQKNGVSVLLGNGDGTFQPPVDYGAGEYPSAIAAADLDGDGALDLAVANYAGDNISVLLAMETAPQSPGIAEPRLPSVGRQWT